MDCAASVACQASAWTAPRGAHTCVSQADGLCAELLGKLLDKLDQHASDEIDFRDFCAFIVRACDDEFGEARLPEYREVFKLWRHQELSRSCGNSSDSGKEVIVKIQRKEGIRLGIDVAADEENVTLTHVSDGPVADWNNMHPHEAVCAGDQILAINGTRGKDMLKVLRCSPTLEFIVRRNLVNISIQKSEGVSLGISLTIDAEMAILTKVGDGPLSDWNDAHPDKAVGPGDAILSINGNTGKEMITVMKDQQTQSLEFVVRRTLDGDFDDSDDSDLSDNSS